MPPCRIGELRQKGEEKYRHLWIGDIHDDAASVESGRVEMICSGCRSRLSPSPESLPRQIEQIAGSGKLEAGERRLRCLEESCKPECHCRRMEQKSGAESQRNEQTGLAPLLGGLGHDEQVVRSWGEGQQDRGGKKHEHCLWFKHVYPLPFVKVIFAIMVYKERAVKHDG